MTTENMVTANFDVTLSVDPDALMLEHEEGSVKDDVPEFLRQLILNLLTEWQLNSRVTSVVTVETVEKA